MHRYTEFVIHADERELAAYLAGFVSAAGPQISFVLASRAGFHIGALRRHLKHHGETTHVICEALHGERLRAALAKAPPDYHFDTMAEREIERAYFSFSFETPNRTVAERIKNLLAMPGEGVKVSEYTPRETTEPGARGAELYSPAHEYTFRGRGVIEGDVMGVIAARRGLLDIEFTKCDEIAVHYAK